MVATSNKVRIRSPHHVHNIVVFQFSISVTDKSSQHIYSNRALLKVFLRQPSERRWVFLLVNPPVNEK